MFVSIPELEQKINSLLFYPFYCYSNYVLSSCWGAGMTVNFSIAILLVFGWLARVKMFNPIKTHSEFDYYLRCHFTGLTGLYSHYLSRSVCWKNSADKFTFSSQRKRYSNTFDCWTVLARRLKIINLRSLRQWNSANFAMLHGSNTTLFRTSFHRLAERRLTRESGFSGYACK